MRAFEIIQVTMELHVLMLIDLTVLVWVSMIITTIVSYIEGKVFHLSY